MPNPEQPKARIAVVRITRGEVNFGVQHIQVTEGETNEQIIEKVREKIATDEHMPQDVEVVVESFEDFKQEVIQVHSFPKGDAVEKAIQTRSDPVKFEVEGIEGNFKQLEIRLREIILSETFVGIENTFGQRIWADGKNHEKWKVLIIYKRNLTQEELAEKYSAANLSEDMGLNESGEKADA